MAIGYSRIVLLVLLGAALQGCSSAPRFNKKFGASVRANLAAQVIDPAAAANGNPAVGVDGAAALAAHERYARSFKEKDQSANQSMVGGSGVK
jgi:type IV pilus biogenesis protein CpaD/CtpE